MNIKPKIPKYVEYIGTKKQPPHTLQLMHPKKHIQQSTQKCNKPILIPMGTIIGHSPHPPTCVWVEWIFCYFWCFLTSCFRCSFHCLSRHSFRHSFHRCHHPPHPIRLVVAPAILILLLRCVQYCSHCLHGVE